MTDAPISKTENASDLSIREESDRRRSRRHERLTHTVCYIAKPRTTHNPDNLGTALPTANATVVAVVRVSPSLYRVYRRW